MAEEAPEATNPAEPSPHLRSEEDGKQTLEGSPVGEGDGGLPASAPDVTYDATVLDNEHCPEGTKDCTENGDGETAGTKKKVEEAVRLGQRTEGDGREEEEEQGKGGQSENDDEEWMDILGSGALKKKV